MKRPTFRCLVIAAVVVVGGFWFAVDALVKRQEHVNMVWYSLCDILDSLERARLAPYGHNVQEQLSPTSAQQQVMNLYRVSCDATSPSLRILDFRRKDDAFWSRVYVIRHVRAVVDLNTSETHLNVDGF